MLHTFYEAWLLRSPTPLTDSHFVPPTIHRLHEVCSMALLDSQSLRNSSSAHFQITFWLTNHLAVHLSLSIYKWFLLVSINIFLSLNIWYLLVFLEAEDPLRSWLALFTDPNLDLFPWVGLCLWAYVFTFCLHLKLWYLVISWPLLSAVMN